MDKNDLKVMEQQSKESKKDKRLTLDYFIKNKTDIISSKLDKLKTITFKIKRFDNLELIAQIPTIELLEDIENMEEKEARRYILYNCIIEPNIKSAELHKEYGLNATNRESIIDKIFTELEIIALCNKLIFSSNINCVEIVDDIKKQ